MELSCFGQSDSTLKFSEVVQMNNLNKLALYQRSRGWINDVFRSSKNVIQIDDKETREIAGNGALTANLYKDKVDYWMLIDNSGTEPELIAEGRSQEKNEIVNGEKWITIHKLIDDETNRNKR